MARRRRILLVEDEADVRRLVRLRLDVADGGVDVVAEVDTAEEAIDLTDRLHPDVIVLDNQLAGKLSGVEAAPTLKAASPQSAIVLYSASVSVEASVEGVDAVVSKMAPLAELELAVLRVSGASGA